VFNTVPNDREAIPPLIQRTQVKMNNARSSSDVNFLASIGHKSNGNANSASGGGSKSSLDICCSSSSKSNFHRRAEEIMSILHDQDFSSGSESSFSSFDDYEDECIEKECGYIGDVSESSCGGDQSSFASESITHYYQDKKLKQQKHNALRAQHLSHDSHKQVPFQTLMVSAQTNEQKEEARKTPLAASDTVRISNNISSSSGCNKISSTGTALLKSDSHNKNNADIDYSSTSSLDNNSYCDYKDSKPRANKSKNNSKSRKISSDGGSSPASSNIASFSSECSSGLMTRIITSSMEEEDDEAEEVSNGQMQPRLKIHSQKDVLSFSSPQRSANSGICHEKQVVRVTPAQLAELAEFRRKQKIKEDELIKKHYAEQKKMLPQPEKSPVALATGNIPSILSNQGRTRVAMACTRRNPYQTYSESHYAKQPLSLFPKSTLTTTRYSSAKRSPIKSCLDSHLYSLGSDIMSECLSYLPPLTVHMLLTAPLSKTFRSQFTQSQDVWRTLCLSKPFYARPDHHQRRRLNSTKKTMHSTTNSTTSKSPKSFQNDVNSSTLSSDLNDKNYVFGQHRMLYTSFIRCMKYLDRIREGGPGHVSFQHQKDMGAVSSRANSRTAAAAAACSRRSSRSSSTASSAATGMVINRSDRHLTPVVAYQNQPQHLNSHSAIASASSCNGGHHRINATAHTSAQHANLSTSSNANVNSNLSDTASAVATSSTSTVSASAGNQMQFAAASSGATCNISTKAIPRRKRKRGKDKSINTIYEQNDIEKNCNTKMDHSQSSSSKKNNHISKELLKKPTSSANVRASTNPGGISLLTSKILGPSLKSGTEGPVDLPWSCAIYSVMNWMVAFSDVLGIQIMCLKVLPHLLEDEKQRTSAQRVGLTDIVLRGMVVFPDSVELHILSFHTVVLLARPLGGKEGMLFHSSRLDASRIFPVGSCSGRNGIAVMLDSMKRFGKNAMLQSMACWSMVNLALIPSQKAMLVKLGGIGAAAGAMMMHPFDQDVQFRALFALINLVIPSSFLQATSSEAEAVRQQLGDLNAISEREMLEGKVSQIANLVVVAMKHFCASEAILNRACLVLHNLSLNDAYHTTLLWTPNCYQMLEWSMGNYPNDPVLQQSAGVALQRLKATLANDDSLRQRFTESIRVQQQESEKRSRMHVLSMRYQMAVQQQKS